ncbi:MucR family transcriptional regulator [Methylobacterium trifolii]|uniref:Transcriptional regulatory protein ros n=1 Tax=Methylobacterium trifolii TaxID=1003092 RepID=A0ABQ4TY74_9HYPH|nr:MucR family transcriptional regulator [Methylobacterium trifolii]GJE59479.1 Transcriptional regulatory protein ros [Methylobacterium trifolii]
MMYNLTDKTIDIVSVYLQRNNVDVTQVATLIKSVYSALRDVNERESTKTDTPVDPPVPIAETVTPDYIISLEDGKPYKTLGRHLLSRGLTPSQYRAKWGLDPSYPLIAANYAAERAAISRKGGRRGRKAPEDGGEQA